MREPGSGSPCGDPCLTEQLEQAVEGGRNPRLTVQEVIETFGPRAYGPLLFLPAFFAVAPTGGIPGVTVVAGALVILVAIQIPIGRGNLVMPARLRRLSLKRDAAERAIERARPLLRRIERVTRRRLTWLVSPPWVYVSALVCVALGAAMGLLEFIPFASAAPGAAVLSIAVGMIVCDGLAVLVGYGLASASAFLVAGVWSGLVGQGLGV